MTNVECLCDQGTLLNSSLSDEIAAYSSTPAKHRMNTSLYSRLALRSRQKNKEDISTTCCGKGRCSPLPPPQLLTQLAKIILSLPKPCMHFYVRHYVLRIVSHIRIFYSRIYCLLYSCAANARRSHLGRSNLIIIYNQVK